MNLGQISIWVAFLTSVTATYFFYNEGKNISVARSKKPSTKKEISSRLFWIMSLAVLLASFFMYYLLLSHQFQYAYVAQFSSRSQSLLYTISAFWAGQEGTFLLWSLLVSWMGIVFIKTQKEK